MIHPAFWVRYPQTTGKSRSGDRSLLLPSDRDRVDDLENPRHRVQPLPQPSIHEDILPIDPHRSRTREEDGDVRDLFGRGHPGHEPRRHLGLFGGHGRHGHPCRVVSRRVSLALAVECITSCVRMAYQRRPRQPQRSERY